MYVILKWNGISKNCEWNSNSLDLATIIQTSTFYVGYTPHLYSDMICWYTYRMKSVNIWLRISPNRRIYKRNFNLNLKDQ
jgi:hypothetical protein